MGNNESQPNNIIDVLKNTLKTYSQALDCNIVQSHSIFIRVFKQKPKNSVLIYPVSETENDNSDSDFIEVISENAYKADFIAFAKHIPSVYEKPYHWSVIQRRNKEFFFIDHDGREEAADTIEEGPCLRLKKPCFIRNEIELSNRKQYIPELTKYRLIDHIQRLLNPHFNYWDFFSTKEHESIQRVCAATYTRDISMVGLILAYAKKDRLPFFQQVSGSFDFNYYQDAFIKPVNHSYYLSYQMGEYMLPEHKKYPEVHIFYDKNRKMQNNNCISGSVAANNYLVRLCNDHDKNSLMEIDICHSIDMDTSRFHPKFLLLEIHNGNENTNHYKLAILSRNLTRGDHREQAVTLVLDQKETDSVDCTLIKDFSDIFNRKDIKNDNQERFNALSRWINSCYWKTEDGHKAEVFIQFPQDDYRIQQFMADPKRGKILRHHSYVIVPNFNNFQPSEWITSVVSRNHIRNYYSLSGLDEKEKTPAITTHEKVYLFKRVLKNKETKTKTKTKTKTYLYELWSGSSNCSDSGLGCSDIYNVESMVCIHITQKEYRYYKKHIEKYYSRINSSSSDDDHMINELEDCMDDITLEISLKNNENAEASDQDTKYEYDLKYNLGNMRYSNSNYKLSMKPMMYSGEYKELKSSELKFTVKVDAVSDWVSIITSKRDQENKWKQRKQIIVQVSIDNDSRECFNTILSKQKEQIKNHLKDCAEQIKDDIVFGPTHTLQSDGRKKGFQNGDSDYTNATLPFIGGPFLYEQLMYDYAIGNGKLEEKVKKLNLQLFAHKKEWEIIECFSKYLCGMDDNERRL